MTADHSRSAPSHDWPPSSRVAADDMHDSVEDRGQYTLLAPLLEDCVPLAEQFAQWDGAARAKLRLHSLLLMTTAVCATLAVVLAIYQLAGIESDLVIHAEAFCAAFAAVAVLFGVWATFDHLWRLRRFQAEHARLIKFGFLLNAAHWLKHRAEGRAFLSDHVQRLGSLNHHAPEEWVLNHRQDLALPRTTCPDLDNALLRQLVEYFRVKRIGYQAAYFRREGQLRKSRERISASLPVLLFALSLVAAIAHYALHSYSRELADALLLLAACLPVFAAGIRTVRGAMEYARNANRYHSLYVQLFELDQRLESQQAAACGAEKQLLTLNDVELALETEHRSWQRLMIETEWFG